MNVKLKFLLLFWFLLLCSPHAHSQFYSVHTDAIGLAGGTINGGISAALTDRWSLHLPVQYNPWTLSDNKKLKQLTLQPGVRYWFDQSFGYGWFLGLNAVVSRYNFGGLLSSDYRYNGMAYGGGLSTGFSLPLSKLWNLEFEIGGGAVYSHRDKYNCVRCGDKITEEKSLYLVPTKICVNLVYLF